MGHLLLFGTGCVAGLLNVVAGGGSFLTLPVLIFLGLPATIANGTNRVSILLQNGIAVWGFNRYGFMDWKSLLWAALPASGGAVLGTWFALIISESDFQRLLALLMVALTLLTLWKPSEKRQGQNQERKWRGLILGGAFFLVGIYGGFVQAGVGFLILAVTSLAGLDLVRGNAIKVLAILSFTVISLSMFAGQGKVYWEPGIVLGIGTVIGGHLGVRLTILKGHGWIRTMVTITILVFAVKLWLGS